MNGRFGPWTTALNAGGCASLSTFWRLRMARLSSIGDGSLRLSRREALRLGLGGTALAVLPTVRVTTARGGANEDTPGSPKGMIYVYAEWQTANADEMPPGVYAVDPEANTRTKVLSRPDDEIDLTSFRVSPDGAKMAYCYSETITNEDDKIDYIRPTSLWVRGLRDGEVRKVLDVGGYPIWSSDGKQLVFRRGNLRRGGWAFETWRVDSDGLNAMKLPIPKSEEVHDWSPDGSWLVSVGSRLGEEGYQLYVMHPDGTGRRRLTESGLNVEPRFSPDSRRIAFIGCEEGKKRNLDVITLDGRDRRRVYEESDDNYVDGVCWSRDGTQLAAVVKTWSYNEDGQKAWSVDHRNNPRLFIFSEVGGWSRRILRLPPALELHALDWR